ncbi:hypothetical protein [Pseudomonas sp. PS01301]|uniref:hypothetical protein n=1 Tax=Pseudomonas sp. PS01301 TaxID=2991437 RepID=UPI00249A6142|nr:hypothetical protein [Pseudomonas sp. PS01301]
MMTVKRSPPTAGRVLLGQFGVCAFGLVATLAVASLIAGCQTVQPAETRQTVPTETVQVQVPIAVPCIKEKPAPVEYGWRKGPLPVGKDEADTLKIKVGILLKDAELAKARDQAWEAATVGCLVTPPGP